MTSDTHTTSPQPDASREPAGGGGPTDGARHIAASFDHSRARFQARHLHALEPLIRASQDEWRRWTTAGLIVEPVASGGAVLVTTDGRSLAAIFDASARATRPLRITISDDLFAAVKPRDAIAFVDQGDTFEMPLPEWAQPGEVYAWSLSAFVSGLMPHPAFEEDEGGLLANIRAEDGNTYAGGYRIHKEPPTLDWRRVFAAERGEPAGRFNLYPDILARFGRIERLFREGMQVFAAGESQALILTLPGHPEFVGAMMPNEKSAAEFKLPEWARATPSPGPAGADGAATGVDARAHLSGSPGSEP